MKVSVVTPSYRQLSWLKRCIRSVEDQGVEVEHIIQDAGTGPELEQWVREQSSAKLFVEKDKGMYDAINRGFARATGEICAFLNCDEQYLPGALQRVVAEFAAHPEADLIHGDFLVVDSDQELICFRKATKARAAMIRSDHLYNYTCAMFFRRRVFEAGFHFNPELKDVADAQWVCRVLEAGFRPRIVRQYLATFTFTGDNRSAQPWARGEALAARKALPLGLRLAGPVLREWRHLEKLLRGAYFSPPIRYEVYADGEERQRREFLCERPQHRYPTA